MAKTVNFSIKLLPGEKDDVCKAIKKIKKKKIVSGKIYASSKNMAISVSAIAKEVGQGTNHVRFIVDELVAEGRVLKIPLKDENRYYRRYTFEVVE